MLGFPESVINPRRWRSPAILDPKGKRVGIRADNRERAGGIFFHAEWVGGLKMGEEEFSLQRIYILCEFACDSAEF